MLAAAQLELITAAVDGELSAGESRALLRLLETSPEARNLYTKLLADRDRVCALPQAAPPADLRAKIMAKVVALTPVTTPKPAKPTPAPSRRASPWVPVAIAASVLLCITAGSFAFFSQNGSSASAKKQWHNDLPASRELPVAVPSPLVQVPREQPPQPDPAQVVRNDVSPVPEPRPAPPEAIAIAPTPRPASHDLLGHQLFPKFPSFDLVQARVPFLRAVAELDREDTRQELTDELTHDPAYRFDLFVRDTARGVDVFQNAAKAAGLKMFADATTLDRLKKRQVAAVMIYTESLTPEELTALFTKIAAEDKKFSPRVCDSLHALPVARHDELELKVVLGTDVGLYKRPHTSGNGSGTGAKTPLLDKNGNPKSVSAGTIDSVAKSLTTPPAKLGEKPAILMTWQSVYARTNPMMSNELKQFLLNRSDRKPNAVPAIIVIRPVG